MRVIEVSMERRRNERVGKREIPIKPATNCIVRHDSHLQKSGDPKASRLTAQPPWPPLFLKYVGMECTQVSIVEGETPLSHVRHPLRFTARINTYSMAIPIQIPHPNFSLCLVVVKLPFPILLKFFGQDKLIFVHFLKVDVSLPGKMEVTRCIPVNSNTQKRKWVFTNSLKQWFPFLKKDDTIKKVACTLRRLVLSVEHGERSDITQHVKKKKKKRVQGVAAETSSQCLTSFVSINNGLQSEEDKCVATAEGLFSVSTRKNETILPGQCSLKSRIMPSFHPHLLSRLRRYESPKPLNLDPCLPACDCRSLPQHPKALSKHFTHDDAIISLRSPSSHYSARSPTRRRNVLIQLSVLTTPVAQWVLRRTASAAITIPYAHYVILVRLHLAAHPTVMLEAPTSGRKHLRYQASMPCDENCRKYTKTVAIQN
ncbi:hypothetical protein PR048_025014 [Dryococelus australis]|uniref:Uncharacterized protein n=1 Tax=Dryococelus australis TaxID=614101 RepID=A0ABQ9GQ45_9NEOP|nr:hypothetical protein PR048_025014 [Dryococelus australis]